MPRRKPVYFYVGSMNEIIYKETSYENDDTTFEFKEFKTRAELDKFYNKFVREFNKKIWTSF